MNISPQSLARSRDKRSHRIPARFDDFSSEIPSDLALRKALENSKRQKGAITRQSTSSSEQSESPEIMSMNTRRATGGNLQQSKPATSVQTPTITLSPAQTKRNSSRSQRSQQSGTSTPQPEGEIFINTKSDPSPASQTPDMECTSKLSTGLELGARKAPSILRTPADKGTLQDSKRQLRASDFGDIKSKNTTSKAFTELEARLRDFTDKIKSTDQEKPPLQNASKTISPQSSQETEIYNLQSTSGSEALKMTVKRSSKKDEFITSLPPGPSLKPATVNEKDDLAPPLVIDETPPIPLQLASRENIIMNQDDTPPSKTNMPNLEQALRRPDGNIIRKSPFHPSITISGNAAQKSGLFQPKNEKRLSSEPELLTLCRLSTKGRKKSKGHSLIKQNIAGTPARYESANVTPNHMNMTNRLPGGQQQQQQAKYVANTQNVQSKPYRLMLNEGIYLPTSVAPIQPITVTYPAIANLARRYPFVSKKTEACMDYQDTLRMSSLFSGHDVMVKIAKNLNLKDRIKVRLVSKSWKTVIDASAELWKSLTLTSEDSDKIAYQIIHRIIKRYGTRELILKDYHGDLLILGSPKYLDRITFISTSPKFNKQILQYICTSRYLVCNITWRVKVVIDENGIAWAEFDHKSGDDSILREFQGLCFGSPASETPILPGAYPVNCKSFYIEAYEIEKHLEKTCASQDDISKTELELTIELI